LDAHSAVVEPLQQLKAAFEMAEALLGKRQKSDEGARRRTQVDRCVDYGFTIPTLARFRADNNNFIGMHVFVAPVPKKGLGLIAQHDIPAGTRYAYYFVRLYKKVACLSSPYLIGTGVPGYVGNLCAKSFQRPGEDNIPYVAPMANEPNLDVEPNSGIVDVAHPSRWHRKTVLVTNRLVLKGEELTWDYGPGYGQRPYPSKYNN
jgi:hypothetical protein